MIRCMARKTAGGQVGLVQRKEGEGNRKKREYTNSRRYRLLDSEEMVK